MSLDGGNEASNLVLERSGRPPRQDDFETVKLVSNGAYGAVYLVRHVQTGKKFALKKLKKLNLALRNQLDQVFAERDILTFSDNPFVVSFYGSFETKKHLCMVMEYVEGGDCAALLKHIGVFPLGLARLYIAETVLAIEYLHSYGIVHRDLKPDNLLITSLGHIKLTDFGLSKIGLMNRTNLLYEGCLDLSDTQQFQDRQICGTPEYIAPEVILMNGYGKPVDWWALGCILYEFLVGVVPFFGDTPEELFSHVISDEVQWPEDSYAPPQSAKDLISQLVQQNPLDRLGTVNGAIEIKSHPFFEDLNWNSLLRQKAEFVPQLEGEEDTSYFDTRSDRYNHEVESDNDESEYLADESVVFSSFSSCSPRYSYLTEQPSTPMHRPSDASLSVDSATEDMVGSVVMRSAAARGSAPVTPRPLSQPVGAAPYVTASEQQQATTAADIAKDVAIRPTPSEAGHAVGGPLVEQRPKSSQQQQPQTGAAVVVRRRSNTVPLHRLAVSMDLGDLEEHTQAAKELSPVDELTLGEGGTASATIKPQVETSRASDQQTTLESKTVSHKEQKLTGHEQKEQLTVFGHQFVRQCSTPTPSAKSKTQTSPSQGLHLVIPSDSRVVPAHDAARPSLLHSPGASSLSSRDESPTGTAAAAAVGSTSQHHRQNRYRTTTSSSGGGSPQPGTSSSTGGGNGGGASSSGSDPHLLSPLISQQKPPIVVKKGPTGYGFTFKTVRVYLGESDYYTIQHVVTVVEPNSPAQAANLQPDDLITHVNGHTVQNMTHPHVVQLMLSMGEMLTLRVSPLDQTSIKQGGAPRHSAGKLARRKGFPGQGGGGGGGAAAKQKLQRKFLDKKNRKSSLFRRLSGKRANAELSALGLMGSMSALAAPLAVSCAMQRSASTCESLTSSPLLQHPLLSSTPPPPAVHKLSAPAPCSRVAPALGPRVPGPQCPLLISPPGGKAAAASDSSNSSSPASSVPNSPSSPFLGVAQHRPSTLHGLKHKLAQTLRSPTRRKQNTAIPLSPLARSEPSYFAAPPGQGVSTQASSTYHEPTSYQSPNLPLVQTVASSGDRSTPLLVARPHHSHHPSHLSTSPSRSPSPLAAGCSTTTVSTTGGGTTSSCHHHQQQIKQLCSSSTVDLCPSPSQPHRTNRALSVGGGGAPPAGGLLKKTITRPKKSTEAVLCPVLTDEGKKSLLVESGKQSAANK